MDMGPSERCSGDDALGLRALPNVPLLRLLQRRTLHLVLQQPVSDSVVKSIYLGLPVPKRIVLCHGRDC